MRIRSHHKSYFGSANPAEAKDFLERVTVLPAKPQKPQAGPSFAQQIIVNPSIHQAKHGDR